MSIGGSSSNAMTLSPFFADNSSSSLFSISLTRTYSPLGSISPNPMTSSDILSSNSISFSFRNKVQKEHSISKSLSSKSIEEDVKKIINDVKKNGDKALLKYERKFNKNNIIVPSEKQINKSIKSLDKKVKKAIDDAYNRIYKFHSLQKFKNISYKDKYKNKIDFILLMTTTPGESGGKFNTKNFMCSSSNGSF